MLQIWFRGLEELLQLLDFGAVAIWKRRKLTPSGPESRRCRFAFLAIDDHIRDMLPDKVGD